MSVYIFALLLLCLFGIKFSFKDGFEDYMSVQKTGAIKGIFVIIVFFQHARQYVTIEKTAVNEPFTQFMLFLGQLMVVVFLFYSGYGVALGLQKKPRYVLTIPKKRILSVWYHFAVAIVIFFVVGRLLGTKYDLVRLLKSFVGLSAVGNSVWFIFTILMLYALTFFVFVFAKDKMIIPTAVLTVLSFALMLVLRELKGKEYWWYDTLMCYPLGMWYYIAKPTVDKLLLKDFSRWFSMTAIVTTVFGFIAFLMPIYHRTRKLFIPEALVFALVIVLVSMRVSIDNKVLRWFGKRVFSIYILQRIPMIIFSKLALKSNPVLFTLVCFAVTVVIAELFDRLLEKCDILLHIKKAPPKKLEAVAKADKTDA